MEDYERLRDLARGSDWLMHALRTVRSLDLPDWVIGSGAIRNLVWDTLHGYAEPTPPKSASRRRSCCRAGRG